MFDEEEWDVPRHLRMANENIFFRGTNVKDVDLLRLTLHILYASSAVT